MKGSENLIHIGDGIHDLSFDDVDDIDDFEVWE